MSKSSNNSCFVITAILLLASTAFAQEIKRPTFELDAGSTIKCGFGTKQASAGMSFAYDAAGQSTGSAIATQGTVSASFYKSRSFSAWQAPSSSYGALTLNVNSQDVETNQTGSTAQGKVLYSTDNGATWNTLVISSGNGWTRRTSTFTLSAAQDLSQLKVGVCVQSSAGGDTPGPVETVTVYDIWTVGTTTPQGGGSGSTSASPQRELVIVN